LLGTIGLAQQRSALASTQIPTVNVSTRRLALVLALGAGTICLAVYFHRPTPVQYHLGAITKLRRMHEPKVSVTPSPSASAAWEGNRC